MNKKAFVDLEVIASPGFIILVAMAVSATLLGWKLSGSWSESSLPFWQVIIAIVVEVVAAYFFAARG